MEGPLPDWLAACVAATVFLVMFSLGLSVTPRELREAWGTPGPLARGILVVVVAVPLQVNATIVACLIISALIIVPYEIWRRRAAAASGST